MNVSEKQLDEPLLPITNPITHVNPQDATATTSPSRAQKIFAAAEAFNRVMERVNRSFYAIAMFWMIVIQLLCLSVILWYSAELTYLFVIGRRVNSPELALEVVCYISPFIAIGMGVRFMELLSVFFKYREMRTVPVPAN